MSAASNRPALWISLLLAALTVVTYLPTLRCGFVNWDDMEHVVRNPDMNPPSMGAVERYWVRPYFGLWAPVTYTVWLGAAWVGGGDGAGLNPHVFHAVNLVVHVVGTILVFLIVRRMIGAPWPAAIGAAVFAVHPIQVESVAWVSGLRDVLAGMWSLLAIWIFLVSMETRGTRRRRWLRVGATIFFVLGLLSKPTAAVVPIMLAIIVGMRWREIIRWLGLWLLLAAADLAVAVGVQPSGDVYHAPIWGRALVGLDAIGFYGWKIFVPGHFTMDYGRSPDWLLAHPRAWWLAGLAAVAIVVVVIWRKRMRLVGVGLAIGVAALLPVLGLEPFSFQYFSTVADRYAYLAMLGVAVAVAALLVMLPRWSWWLGGIAVISLAVAANRQVGVWRDTGTLCDQALAVNHGSVAALRILGFDALQNGDWERALQYNDRAMKTKPDDPLLLFDRGNALRAAGQLNRALAAYGRAVNGRPHDPQVRNNYAVLLAQTGNDAEAEREFERVLRESPEDAEARANWATYLAGHGRREEALAEFRRALADDPRSAVALRGIRILTGNSEK